MRSAKPFYFGGAVIIGIAGYLIAPRPHLHAKLRPDPLAH
jgi:hypothetical protein